MGFEQQIQSIVDVVKKHHKDNGKGRCTHCEEDFPCDAVSLCELIEALVMRCTKYATAVDYVSAQLSYMTLLMKKQSCPPPPATQESN